MTIAVLGVLGLAGVWVASSIGAGDPRREGDVIKVETLPDGSTDVYRGDPDGEIVIEHQEADGEVWFESNAVIGDDGEPIICPDGEPLRIDFDALDADAARPSLREARAAQRDLPAGKRAVFNQYTGRFQAVEAVPEEETYGEVTVGQPLVYQCGPNNQPVLVPLSKVDPQAARAAHRRLQRQLRHGDELTGLGQNAAGVVRSASGR